MASMSLQEALDRARRWLENNEIERATGLSQHILEHYPSTIEAHRILGEACLAERRLDASQAAFEHVLAIDPENIPAHVGLGIVFERRQKIERAMVEFERAFEIKPDLPELRSQLLRLYGEAWGGEQAKLRLSRAGLARMYARGHMLSQAIAEFRQVTEAQPDRYDAQVALAETLWRNEQEDDAADLCRRLLQKQPTMLKPNLLLGYIELHAGRAEGERYWHAAHQADPGMQMARTLFATLPDVAEEPLTLPEWDEIAWRNRRAAQVEEPELVGSTRAMEAHAVTPTAVVAVPVIAVPAVAAVAQNSSDDFLAQLLALESPPLATQPPRQPAPSSDFVFDDLLDTTAITRPMASTAPDLSPEEEASLSDLPPFSLADLGLSDREIAALNAAETEPAPAPEPPRIEPVAVPARVVDESITDIGAAIESGTLAPFSFADLGLSDEEIAALTGAETITPASIETAATLPVVTPHAPVDESITDIGAAIESGTLAPFSFADLGLSDEEIAALNAATEAPATAAIETAQAAEQPAALDSITDIGAAIESGTLAPFSFADLGLSDEEIAALNAATDAPATGASAADTDTVPFSLADLGIDEDMTVTPKQASARAAAAETISPELAPFSFESIESIDDDDPFGELPAALQPFSLDEIGADVAASNAFLPGSLGSSLVRPREDETEALNLSWQEPGSRLGSSLVRPPSNPTPSDEPSLFDKLSARRATGELPPLPPEVAEDALEEEEHLGLFSLDNVSLREDETDEPDRVTAMPTTPASDTIRSVVTDVPQPFSLDDLGLNADEMAALGLGTAPVVPIGLPVVAETEMFSLADLGIADDQPAISTEREITDIGAAIDAGELAPFSFADLGLSDAEVAALGLTSEPPTAPATPVAADDDEFADFAASLTPFSFSDLGLDGDTPTTTTGSGDGDAALNVTPFSLTDLGLEEDTDSEIDPGARLGLTEEELEGLASGGDVDWAAVETTAPAFSASPEPTPPEYYVSPGGGSVDPALDRLMMLGRLQGQVDISDIIAAVEHPEENADRIEYIGAQLHASGIAIFDGEELIDMDAEAVDADEPAASTSYLPEPVFGTPVANAALEPFSLGDLGLLDDLDTRPVAPSPVAAPSATEEIAALEPFSLAELGLTDDEIAMFPGSTPTPAPAPVSSSPIESVSLDALGLDTTSAPATPAPLAAPPSTVAPVAVPAAVLPPPRIISGVSTTFAGFVAQVEQDPENIVLRLSVARAGMQLGEGEIGLRLYRDLIRRGAMLEDLTIDIGELVEEIDDIAIVRRLYRILGDAYTRQGRIDEAMQAFAASRA